MATYFTTIAGEQGLIIQDEFTSVVDRTVAQVGSAAFAKRSRGFTKKPG